MTRASGALGFPRNMKDDPVGKLLRAFSRAKANNPIDAPLWPGSVTITHNASASATATRKYLVADNTIVGMAAFTGGTPTKNTGSANRYNFPVVSLAPSTTGGNMNGGPTGQNAWLWSADFVTDSSEVELNVLGNTTLGFRLLIDGQYVSSYEPTAFSFTGQEFINLVFSTRKTRRITFEAMYANSIYGISVLPSSNIRKYLPPDPILHIGAGDSKSEGQGATWVGAQSHQYYLGKRLGATDTRLMAIGSTGVISNRTFTGNATTTQGSASVTVTAYTGTFNISPGAVWTQAGVFPAGTTVLSGTIAAGGTGTLTLSNPAASAVTAGAFSVQCCNAFPDQIPTWFTTNTDIVGANVDLVTISHSYNDYSWASNNPSLITPAPLLALQRIRAACPKAVILWCGANTGLRNNDAGTISIETQIAAAVTQFADKRTAFIAMSNITPPLFFGTGKVGATNNSGNTDVMISADGVHESTLGHQHWAQYFAMQAHEAVRAMRA